MPVADLVLLVLMGLGFMVGFFRGFIRAAMALGAWAVCFLLAVYIRSPVGDWLTRSASFNAFYADMISFAALFFAFFIAALVVITFSRTPTALAGHPLLDDISGGIVGVLVVVLVVATVMVILSTYYRVENPPSTVDLGMLAELHRALLSSTIATVLSNTVVPLVAFVFGPVLPTELVQVMA